MTRLSPEVRIVEVGPRDGLQNVQQPISTEVKIELIQRLREAGLQTIELTSVVSPKRIPQLADCQQVLKHPAIKALTVRQPHDLRLPVLVPNSKGLEIALSHGVKEVAVFVSAADGFSKANANCSVEQGIERARSVATAAIAANVTVRGYVSCIFEDPYDGATPLASALHCVRELFKMGCYEVSLGDTTGVGTPAKTATLIGYLVQNGVPVDRLAGHFHDTYGKGAANVIQAYLCGVRAFDSSVAGLGGCPFAPGAKGNVATEDLVYMFQNAGVDTGINLSRLIDTSRWISQRLGPSHTTHIGRALASKRGAQRLSRRQHAEKSELLWLPVKETDCLQTFRSGDNVRIVLNRPRNGNALTRPVISELTAIVTTLNKDPSVSRIVLTGSGKYFCSGFEREEAYISRTRRRDMTKVAQFGHLMTLFAAIDESPKLFVACINGPAVGAGAGLAFACHFRIMIRSATVTLRETKPNMFAAIVSRYVTREWDLAFARDAILSARSISGVELSTLGLVTELVDGPKDMQPALDDLLLRLDESASETTELFRKLGRIDWSNLGEGRRRSSTATPEERVVDPDPDANFSCRGTKQEQPCDGDVGAGLHDKSKL